MKKFCFVIIALAAALSAQAQFSPDWDNAVMQAPQIVDPRPCDSVEDAPVLDFTKPVTFAWLGCTNPSGAMVQMNYTVYFYRLMGMHPSAAVSQLEPVYEADNLMVPQFTYFAPLSQRIGTFIAGEPYAFVVKATVMSMDGTPPPPIENNGFSGYSVFIVDDPEQIP